MMLLGVMECHDRREPARLDRGRVTHTFAMEFIAFWFSIGLEGISFVDYLVTTWCPILSCVADLIPRCCMLAKLWLS
jgi:hypothetical protein